MNYIYNLSKKSATYRRFIRLAGGPVIIPNKVWGYDYVLLGKLLENDELFEQVFKNISSSMAFYLRLVLTEKIGMNLRNHFAHGISKAKFLTRFPSDRLFHILLCLSLVIKKEKTLSN
jgi:hypothetical protein